MKSKKQENTTAVAVVEIPESQIATSITQQYEDLQSATAEIVRRTLHFGATLAQAEIELEKRGILKNRKAGQGMQSWLSTHCPSVNYKTAMRWKSLASQVANSLSCSSDQALKLLTGDVIDVPQKVTNRLDKVFEASSLRKLTQQLFDFASEGGGSPGRPSGTSANSAATENYTAVESASRLWARPLSFVVANRAALFSAAKLLPIDNARDALAELKQLCSALSARIKEQ